MNQKVVGAAEDSAGLETQFGELTLTAVRQRVQSWLDKQGLYPKEGAPGEYSHYIQACYPIASELHYQE
jgi:hypothetical protein